MSYEQDRIHALEELVCDHAMEVSQLRRTMADMAQHQGGFVVAVTMAAFGHADAMTDDQIIEGLRRLRTANTVLRGDGPGKDA